ncbi:MAG: hypothetical protein Q8O25_10090 [Sulfurisoma sp.]|nr:hypothetical protein [Sulfurisoma sp.]
MNIEFGPAKNKINIRKHGIDPGDLRQAGGATRAQEPRRVM